MYSIDFSSSGRGVLFSNVIGVGGLGIGPLPIAIDMTLTMDKNG